MLDDLVDEEALFFAEDKDQEVPKGRKRKIADINVVHDGFSKPCRCFWFRKRHEFEVACR